MANQHADYDYEGFFKHADAESLQNLVDYLSDNGPKPGNICSEYKIVKCDREIHLVDKELDERVIVHERGLTGLMDTADRKLRDLCDGMDYYSYLGRERAREKYK